MTEQPNDGFGNEPTTAELAATSEDPGETSEGAQAQPPVREQMTRLGEELRMRTREQLRRPVSVDPGLASGGRGGASHGPIRGQALLNSVRIPVNDGPSEDNPELAESGKFSQAGLERVRLADRLQRRGFERVRADRWLCSETSVSVELGCSHNEVWVRAYWPDAHRRHDRWVFIDHISTERSQTRSEMSITLDGTRAIEKIEGMRQAVQSGRITSSDHPGSVGLQRLGFKLLVAGAKLPTRAYPDDAGFDLYVSQDVVAEPGQFVDVPCGVSVGLPHGHWARITGRSSAMRVHGLQVIEGIIDRGYTGELYAGVRNTSRTASKLIQAGDRVAQLIIHRNETENFTAVEVDEHEPTARGSNGFGSSGR